MKTRNAPAAGSSRPGTSAPASDATRPQSNPLPAAGSSGDALSGSHGPTLSLGPDAVRQDGGQLTASEVGPGALSGGPNPRPTPDAGAGSFLGDSEPARAFASPALAVETGAIVERELQAPSIDVGARSPRVETVAVATRTVAALAPTRAPLQVTADDHPGDMDPPDLEGKRGSILRVVTGATFRRAGLRFGPTPVYLDAMFDLTRAQVDAIEAEPLLSTRWMTREEAEAEQRRATRI